MPARVQIASFTNFGKGISQKTPPFANIENGLAEDFGMQVAESANNVIMRVDSLEKFPGYSTELSSAIIGTPTITGVYEYKKTGSGAATYTIITAGTKVYTKSGSTLTEIYSGITADLLVSFVTFNNVCIMMNGSELLEYDGTTCQAITMDDPDNIFDTAKPKYAALFRNRIFYTGDNTYPSRVWTPRPGSYNNFDNTLSTVDAFDVSVGDGEKITGINPLSKDLLVIYKQGSIHRLSGSNPFGFSADIFRLEEITREIGCIAPHTIKQVGRDHFFFSTDGLKRLSIVNDYGDVVSADPTYKIQNTINTINYSESVIEGAFTEYYKQEQLLYLHVPMGAGTTNTQTIVHDVVTGANMLRDGITASCGAIVNREYLTGGYDGQIYQQHDSNGYDGDSITSSWESKWIPLAGLHNKKEFRSLRIFFETSGISSIIVQWKLMTPEGLTKVYSKTSESASADVFDVGLFDTMLFDAGGNPIFKKNRLGRGLAIKLKIINNNANEPWKVSRIELGYVVLGRAR